MPGDLVVFASDGEGVVRSSAANDPLVCGVVSSMPGLLLGFEPELAGQPGRVPVALCGRVPCRVVDENGPIQRGDLLTSSSRPGYAMRAASVGVDGAQTHRAGTVIGKALGELSSGMGLIDVFVWPG